jgi:hypothetical protein
MYRQLWYVILPHHRFRTPPFHKLGDMATASAAMGEHVARLGPVAVAAATTMVTAMATSRASQNLWSVQGGGSFCDFLP